MRTAFRRQILVAVALWTAAAGCAPSGGTDSASGGTTGTGGGAPAAGTGGAGTVPAGSGGGTTTAATGGAPAAGSGGAATTGGAGAAPVGSGGTGNGTGTAGSTGTGGAGGVSTASAGGAGGRQGTGGAGGSSVPLTPPVRDTASKIPLSSAPSGYKVEGNYAYGPLATQRLDVLYPNDAGPNGTRILPAVLMFHGGAWIHNFNDANGKNSMSTFFDRFLAHGFIVFNAEYRVADAAPEAAFAPAAVKDALLAAKWCWDYLDYFHGDRTRYVVTGASAGGHLAMMVGMTTPAAALGPTTPGDFTIAAIVDGYGPADIESELSGVAAGWIPASLPNRAAIAKLVNPMTYVRKDIPPMIAVQGALDSTAPVAHTRNLVAKLMAASADVTMHEVPLAGHGFATPASAWPDAEKAMFNWLVAHNIGK